MAPRPEGYNPLGVKNLDPHWIRRLGQTGKDCYDAILRRDVKALGASMNECMKCWEAILPHTVRHPTDLRRSAGDSGPLPVEDTPGPCIPAAAADTCTWCPRRRFPDSIRVTVRIAGA